MSGASTAAIEVVRVTDRRLDRAFLDFPYRLFRDDPCWVPQLRSDAASNWNTEKNPFYSHASIERFVAMREGRVVGRIAAIRNDAHNEYHGEKTGFFGFYDAEDDPSIAPPLFRAVEDHFRALGFDTLRGPVNPSMGSECGLLIEGFDTSPYIMMAHNPPYYRQHLESVGLDKEIDLYAYDLRDTSRIDEVLSRMDGLIDRLKKRHPDLSVRPLDLKHLRRDAFILRDVFDNARRENYGFVPSTEEEYETLVGKLKAIVDPAIVQILEKDGHPVGCLVGLPDWNQALKKTERWPFPLRLIGILLQRRKIRRIRVLAIALTDEYKRSGLLSWLFHAVITDGRKRGYDQAELSWIAENNTVQIHTLRNVFDPTPSKTYRIYTKALGSA